jgi:hypothetical protein
MRPPAPRPLLLSPLPGEAPIVGLTALPGADGRRLIVGLCEANDPSPSRDAIQPLFSLEPDGGATAWEPVASDLAGKERSATDASEGELAWRERSTGATFALWLGPSGIPRASFALGRATRWLWRRGGCSPMMGAARRVEFARRAVDPAAGAEARHVADAASPILARALSACGAFGSPESPVVACDAFRLAFDAISPSASAAPSTGSSKGAIWRFEALIGDDGEFALTPPSVSRAGESGAGASAATANDPFNATLAIQFFGPLTPSLAAERVATKAAVTGRSGKSTEQKREASVDLPSLGVEWIAPKGATPDAQLAWARLLASEGWPGGAMSSGSDASGVAAELRALGFIARKPRDGESDAGGEEDARDGDRREAPFDASLGERLWRVARSAFARDGGESADSEDAASSRAFSAWLGAEGERAEPFGPTFALGAFAPAFRFALPAGAPRSLRDALPANDRAPWLRAARMRLALAPFHAHLRCREALEGLPAVRPLGLAAEEWPAAGEAPPHFLLGEDLLAAGPLPPAGPCPPLMLPPGEWVDYYDGGRHRQRRTLGQADPMPGRVLLMMRSGAILPLFDLGLAAPFATGSAKRPGPSGELILKIAPSGEREAEFHDVYATAGDRLSVAASEAPKLRVSYATDRRGLTLRVVGAPRRLTFILKWHRPGSVLVGPTERALRPLKQATRDEEFVASPDVWIAHLMRDEVLAKTSAEPAGELWLRVEDLAE